MAQYIAVVFLELVVTALQLWWSSHDYRRASLVGIMILVPPGYTLRMCFIFSVKTGILELVFWY